MQTISNKRPPDYTIKGQTHHFGASSGYLAMNPSSFDINLIAENGKIMLYSWSGIQSFVFLPAFNPRFF
jgi:hypothetical protein